MAHLPALIGGGPAPWRIVAAQHMAALHVPHPLHAVHLLPGGALIHHRQGGMGGGPVEGLEGSCCVADVVILNDPTALNLGAGAHIPHFAVHRELLVQLEGGHPRVHVIDRD